MAVSEYSRLRMYTIATAIREKLLTEDPIKGADFAARIMEIPTGGEAHVPLEITAPTGTYVRAQQDAETVEGTAEDGHLTLILPHEGVWTISAAYGSYSLGTQTLIVQATFSVNLEHYVPPAGVISFNGRDGEVMPEAGDYTAEMVGAATPEEVEQSIQQAVLDSWKKEY